ncbi:unnamed protein product [Meganyctiphanes norvegica]|uniref:GTP-binding protein 10 n=2 Tax=Meganyctiphanes norvegica TaxID=48144 RepID=A0AAV2SF26_MEGNR
MKIKKNFIDALRIHVKGGHGGNGFPKFGGIGGKGGDIYVETVEKQTLAGTLSKNPEKRYIANNGGHSKQHCIIGQPGEDLVIPVPSGITVTSDNNKNLGDLNVVGKRVMVSQGGTGGNSRNKFIGQKGQNRNINLILRLIADIGLVGFPNAGKSTLLKAVSNAKPKIASYPFTTLEPMIGTLDYDDGRKITLADLPGLVEGAWANVGMGHSFLRHVERTKVLLYIVDINGFRLGPKYPHRSAIESVILLNKELELYRPDLVEKPSLLVINKMDTANAEEKLLKTLKDLKKIQKVSENFPEEMRPAQFVKFDDVIPCSAKENQESVNHVKLRLRDILDFSVIEGDAMVSQEIKLREQVKRKLSESNIRIL